MTALDARTLAAEPGYSRLIARVIDDCVQPAKGGQDAQFDDEAEFRRRAAVSLRKLVGDLTPEEVAIIVDEASDDVYRYGPLTPLLADPDITDVLVNGPDQVLFDKGGGVQPASVRFRDQQHLSAFITKHVSRMGRVVNRASPVVDVDLPDGSRLHAVIAPLASSGAAVSIRKFRKNMTLDDIVRRGSMAKSDADFLSEQVRLRKNMIIAGGPGAGKTTLLAALLDLVDPAQRVVGIEEVPELRPLHCQYVRLLTRKATGAYVIENSARDLVREALRMRPDRLVIGEVRGPEALDMISAMSTGMDGSMTTLHASSAEAALDRLDVLLELASGSPAAAKLARQAVDLVIFLRRRDDGFRVVEAVNRLRAP